MKNILLACIAAFTLASLVGCSDDNKPASSTPPATMSTDAKDMKK